MQTVQGILIEAWTLLNNSSFFILFGLFLAGIIKILLPVNFVEKHLGKNNTASVIKSSLFGIPLPLCSCGVIPVSIGLRKQGASKGATTAFLIATPETGVDSIAITYALLDPVMTVIRPLAAFITACTAGIIVNLIPEKKIDTAVGVEQNCACKTDQDISSSADNDLSLLQRLRTGFSFSFNNLLADIGVLLLTGFLIAGIISYFVPAGYIEKNLGAGLVPMLIMLAVGIPVYVCATGSTPIVAALALKGLSPGAALIFLLAGPATNAATITVIANMLGKRIAVAYVATIALVALGLGFLVNTIYGLLSIDISHWTAASHVMTANHYTQFTSILLILLIIRAKIKFPKCQNT